MWRTISPAAALAAFVAGAVRGQEPPPPPPIPTPTVPALPEPLPDDRPLPINLASALRLADARPVVIDAARASVEVAVASLQRAKVLWLPDLAVGVDYNRHDGGFQLMQTGQLLSNSRGQLLFGPGFRASFDTSDAVFAPLAARQVLRSAEFDIQTARNDAMLDVAEAYFGVQQARGRLAGAFDAVAKARELVRRVEGLARGLTPPLEVDRARTLLADLEQAAISAREDWKVASANLTRVLRLDPRAVVLPLEPAQTRVTLIDPAAPLDGLIPVALMSRPELASQQALVQATLERLRQEKLRPLLPSVVFTGNAGSAGGPLAGGLYTAGPNDTLQGPNGRFDLTVSAAWQVQNLGLGTRARIREQQARQQQALVELFRVQDLVAAEVARAHAEVESATRRIGFAEEGLARAQTSFAGNLTGLSQTVRFGELLQLVVRPQEAVSALQQLAGAYRNYYGVSADFNRAQFRLFRALGYPAKMLACERPVGEAVPVDTSRPPPLPPVGPGD
jgi:outer membrane protein TolC